MSKLELLRVSNSTPMKDNYDFFSYKNFDEKWEVANQANQPTQKDARLISEVLFLTGG